MEIGFIGLGAIGYPIYQHIAANYKVRFYARRPEVIRAATADGGVAMSSNTALAQQCDTIFLFVNTFAQCRECVAEIAQAGRADITVVIGATVSPTEVQDLCAQYAPMGITILDAPVTGGVKGAQEGVLTTMVSGDTEAFQRCYPVFETYCKKIVYVDKTPGQAEVLKALVQLLVGINSVALSEAMTLGVKAGLQPEMIYDTITNSAGTSRIFENRGQKIMDRDFAKRGTINIINKDMTICSQLAIETKSPMFLGAITKQMFQIAASQNDPQEDFNAVVKVYENMAGIEIKRSTDKE